MSTATANGHCRLSADELKGLAASRWREILISVGGIPADTLDPSREHPCPKCGGNTRFRFIDEQAGAVRCSHCFAEKCGDGFAAIQWARNVTFPEAKQLVADHLGVGQANGKSRQQSPDDVFRTVCSAKRMPETAARAYGAQVVGNELHFPGYDEHLQQCGTFRLGASGKGLWGKGDSAGLFLPHDAAGNPIMPQPGETWLLVEGVKDASALTGLGFKVCGLPMSSMAAKFARLFIGVNVIIVPDLDTPGVDGAKKTKARLEDSARSILTVRLPGEKRDTGGLDVRDVLAQQDGERLLRQAIADAVGDDDQQARRVAYKIITSAELASGDYAVDYLIDDAMVAGQPLIIAGPPKSLKTMFIVDSAVALSTGGYMLGRFNVTRACRVMVMTGESGMGAVQEAAINVCKAARKWLDENQNLFWSEDLPKFGAPEHLSAIERVLTDYEIEVLFIDPAYLCLPSTDSGNLMAQGELLRGMAELCRRVGVTMVLCHHTKKNTGRDPYEPPELPDIAWSGFSEFARQWWLIGRREKYEPGTGSHRLWLSVGGSAGHSGLWAVDVEEGRRTDPDGRRWEVDVKTAGDARADADNGRAERKAQEQAEALDRDKTAACRVLAKALPGGLTKTAIRDGANLGRRLDRVIDALLEGGEIKPFEVTVSNHKKPTSGYRLVGEENA